MNRVALDGCCTLLLTIHVNTLCERLLSLFMLVAATLLFAAPCSVAINKTWTTTPTISLNPWSLIPKNQIGIKRVQGRTHISVIWTSPDSVDVWHLACHALRLLTDSQHTLPFSHLLVAANHHCQSVSGWSNTKTEKTVIFTDRNCLCGRDFLFTFYSLGPNCFEHEPVIQGWMWRSDKSHGGHTCKLVDVGSSKSVICSL